MNELYDVIIIGSGPAGLAAVIYAERARLKTLVLEKEYISGGQVVNTYDVDNYPGLSGIGGFELGMKFREHADKLGAAFETACAEHIYIEEIISGYSENFFLKNCQEILELKLKIDTAMGTVSDSLKEEADKKILALSLITKDFYEKMNQILEDESCQSIISHL